MSDLQDALKQWDQWIKYDVPPDEMENGLSATDVIVEAARMWANPNIEAGVKAYIEKWNELTPHANTRECFEAGLAAAFTPQGDPKE